MGRIRANRKARFESALKLVGLTQALWAESNGISSGHLSMTVNNLRESKRLTDKIDAFIKEVESQKVVAA